MHENAYKAPGFYRHAILDEKRQVQCVQIIDYVHYRYRMLSLHPAKKTATLEELSLPPGVRLGGPFSGYGNQHLKSPELQWVEKRKTPAGEINIFRHSFRDNGNLRDWSYDFWIDHKSKQLIELHSPGTDIYDPDKDPVRNMPPEKEWSKSRPTAEVQRDVVYNAELDDSLFRLEPPEGYTLTVKTLPLVTVTEKEMVDYLGIMADYNGKTFPSEAYPNPREWEKRIAGKSKKDLTPAERKYKETTHRPPYGAQPHVIFIQESTVENSFRYLGKGVKLGDKDRIVCWYKLKDAKNPNTYRVVYGDLSVRDVAAEDLPLPVEP
jgi:hypothetical protein